MFTFSDMEIASELILGTINLRGGESPYSFLVALLRPHCDAPSCCFSASSTGWDNIHPAIYVMLQQGTK